MRKKTLNKEILTLSILTTMTIFSWIAFDIYRLFQKKAEIPQVLKEQLEPLNPNFDLTTLEYLKTRKTINQEELDALLETTEFMLKPKQASVSAEKTETSKE